MGQSKKQREYDEVTRVVLDQIEGIYNRADDGGMAGVDNWVDSLMGHGFYQDAAKKTRDFLRERNQGASRMYVVDNSLKEEIFKIVRKIVD
jgi:hypothetical protein